MDKKLIVFDVDGTLYYRGKISPKTVETIAKVRQAGHVVTIATGRDSTGVFPIADKLQLTDGKTPIVGLNGTEVFSINKNHKVNHLWENIFPKDLTKEVITTARKNSLAFFAYTTDSKIGYVDYKFSFFNIVMKHSRKRKTVRIKKDFSNLKFGIKKFVFFGKQENMNKFISEVKEHNFSIFKWSEATDPRASIELNLPNTDKINGIKEVARELKIAQKDVIFFGDGSNDVESLKWAGIGIAMGNALPDIAKNANEQTLHVKQNGVAHWLEKNILAKKG